MIVMMSRVAWLLLLLLLLLFRSVLMGTKAAGSANARVHVHSLTRQSDLKSLANISGIIMTICAISYVVSCVDHR